MGSSKDNQPIKYHDTYVMCQALIDGTNPNSPDILGQTPLMLAVKKHDYELAENLLAAGADPNGCDRFGTTALMLARDCDIVIAELLLQAGSDIDLKNVFGDTARDIASRHNQRAIVVLLDRWENSAYTQD